jgi:hypothetical protein
MTLSRKIADALDESTRALTPPCTISAEAGPHRLSIELTALDAVGLAFDTLHFTTSIRPEWTTEALKSWADNLATRVNYLMEPLRVVEIDTAEGEVQMRSQTPTPRAEQKGFYEARLSRDGQLRLSRLVFDDSSRRRRASSCQMTREVVERLADDIVAAMP